MPVLFLQIGILARLIEMARLHHLWLREAPLKPLTEVRRAVVCSGGLDEDNSMRE